MEFVIQNKIHWRNNNYFSLYLERKKLFYLSDLGLDNDAQLSEIENATPELLRSLQKKAQSINEGEVENSLEFKSLQHHDQKLLIANIRAFRTLLSHYGDSNPDFSIDMAGLTAVDSPAPQIDKLGALSGNFDKLYDAMHECVCCSANDLHNIVLNYTDEIILRAKKYLSTRDHNDKESLKEILDVFSVTDCSDKYKLVSDESKNTTSSRSDGGYNGVIKKRQTTERNFNALEIFFHNSETDFISIIKELDNNSDQWAQKLLDYFEQHYPNKAGCDDAEAAFKNLSSVASNTTLTQSTVTNHSDDTVREQRLQVEHIDITSQDEGVKYLRTILDRLRSTFPQSMGDISEGISSALDALALSDSVSSLSTSIAVNNFPEQEKISNDIISKLHALGMNVLDFEKEKLSSNKDSHLKAAKEKVFERKINHTFTFDDKSFDAQQGLPANVSTLLGEMDMRTQKLYPSLISNYFHRAAQHIKNSSDPDDKLSYLSILKTQSNNFIEPDALKKSASSFISTEAASVLEGQLPLVSSITNVSTAKDCINETESKLTQYKDLLGDSAKEKVLNTLADRVLATDETNLPRDEKIQLLKSLNTHREINLDGRISDFENRYYNNQLQGLTTDISDQDDPDKIRKSLDEANKIVIKNSTSDLDLLEGVYTAALAKAQTMGDIDFFNAIISSAPDALKNKNINGKKWEDIQTQELESKKESFALNRSNFLKNKFKLRSNSQEPSDQYSDISSEAARQFNEYALVINAIEKKWELEAEKKKKEFLLKKAEYQGVKPANLKNIKFKFPLSDLDTSPDQIDIECQIKALKEIFEFIQDDVVAPSNITWSDRKNFNQDRISLPYDLEEANKQMKTLQIKNSDKDDNTKKEELDNLEKLNREKRKNNLGNTITEYINSGFSYSEIQDFLNNELNKIYALSENADNRKRYENDRLRLQKENEIIDLIVGNMERFIKKEKEGLKYTDEYLDMQQGRRKLGFTWNPFSLFNVYSAVNLPFTQFRGYAKEYYAAIINYEISNGDVWSIDKRNRVLEEILDMNGDNMSDESRNVYQYWESLTDADRKSKRKNEKVKVKDWYKQSVYSKYFPKKNWRKQKTSLIEQKWGAHLTDYNQIVGDYNKIIPSLKKKKNTISAKLAKVDTQLGRIND